VAQHVDLLRQVAHEIAPDPTRLDPPATGDEAHDRLNDLLHRLQEEAPRTGLGAPIGQFIDHVASVAERYGRNLFHCFDDPRIPPTSNGLEGFFGTSKDQLRRALGEASTTNGVAQNLGADYLIALAYAQKHSPSDLLDALTSLSASEYEGARQAVEHGEEPAILRRSRRRNPSRHLSELLDRWFGP
jgi:hypothetical protein